MIDSLNHGIKILLTSSFKFIFYSLFNKRKSRTHFAKAYGMLFSILNINSNYRPNIKVWILLLQVAAVLLEVQYVYI